MNLKSIRREIKALEPNPIDEGFLQVLAIEKVLETAMPEEAAAFETAIEEQLALADAGFSEAEIAGMLRPETLEVLEDLEARAAALLPEIKRQQAALYRRKYYPGIEALNE